MSRNLNLTGIHCDVDGWTRAVPDGPPQARVHEKALFHHWSNSAAHSITFPVELDDTVPTLSPAEEAQGDAYRHSLGLPFVPGREGNGQ